MPGKVTPRCLGRCIERGTETVPVPGGAAAVGQMRLLPSPLILWQRPPVSNLLQFTGSRTQGVPWPDFRAARAKE